MAQVTLHGGLVAIFDDADMALVESMPIVLQTRRTPSGRIYHYVAFKRGKQRGLIHRLLTGAPRGTVVDHRDGNGLNNVRSNLRVCTHAENMRNRRPNVGKVLPKGVSAKCGTYYVQIKAGEIRRHKGGFATPEAASEQYAEWARELHDEYALITPTPGQRSFSSLVDAFTRPDVAWEVLRLQAVPQAAQAQG